MKTRLQLQGELQRADSNAPRVYKNALDVFQKTWRTEGIKGLQRGLFPAVSGRVSEVGVGGMESRWWEDSRGVVDGEIVRVQQGWDQARREEDSVRLEVGATPEPSRRWAALQQRAQSVRG